MIQPPTHNLIFDLGGVIMDLHIDRTHQAFAAIARINVSDIQRKVEDAPFFNEYEKGLLTDSQFRQAVRGLLEVDLSAGEIDAAWNAMLGQIPIERIELLRQLRKKYKVFLLSNTNAIHVESFTKTIQSVSGESSLHQLFDVAYFSHELKMRKPDEEIFQHVLDQNQLKPEHTLFLDDNLSNLAGAEKTGIKTFHVAHPSMIFSPFK